MVPRGLGLLLADPVDRAGQVGIADVTAVPVGHRVNPDAQDVHQVTNDATDFDLSRTSRGL